jgi:hypothetical protein
MHVVYVLDKIFVFVLWALCLHNYAMTNTNTSTAPRHARQALRDSLRLRAAGTRGMGVHFHQGPQGQPTPCFDERCPNPRLSV